MQPIPDSIANAGVPQSSRSTAGGLDELAAGRLAAGDLAGAISAYRQCLTFDPQNAAIHNNLGTVLIKAGQLDEALGALEIALALRPGYVRALVNLGKALRDKGRIEAAVDRLREALVIQPDYLPALVNLGDAEVAGGDLDAAQRTLERAISLTPSHVEAHMALGIARLQGGDTAAALDSLRQAVSLAPEHADAHANLAHALFCGGDWGASWPHFEYRFQRHAQRAPPRPPSRVASWDGIAVPEGELWLVGEQGLGDQLQFARYAQVLQATGSSCVLACDARLVVLLRQCMPCTRVVPFGSAAGEPGTARWIPLMSLPRWHGTRQDTVPHPNGYLAAESRRIDHWRGRLPSPGPRVALAWAGNPGMETGRYTGRSPPLTALSPLFDVPGVNFVSLQKGPGEEQLDTVPFGGSIHRLPDLDPGPDAFLDTAAVLKCVDLLITSDTAIAHLAGALGVATWLCLMKEPDWRWMRGGHLTPWYSSLRLYRQPAPGDWASVYTAAAADLARLKASRYFL